MPGYQTVLQRPHRAKPAQDAQEVFPGWVASKRVHYRAKPAQDTQEVFPGWAASKRVLQIPHYTADPARDDQEVFPGWAAFKHAPLQSQPCSGCPGSFPWMGCIQKCPTTEPKPRKPKLYANFHKLSHS